MPINKINYEEGEDPKSPPGLPAFKNAPYERIDLKHGNSWIVLGKDRPVKNIKSGHSYQESHNYAIDIVVGRRGTNKSEVGPQFQTDAARIYISQKADIDDPIYFNIKDRTAEGGVPNPKSKSAIGLKADSIRIIGTEGVKIVTGGAFNSRGEEIRGKPGIDLIAGNYKGARLQPLVKGANMKLCIKRLLDYISMLQSALMETINYQMSINSTQASMNALLTTHIHPPMPPLIGGPIFPSPTLLVEIPPMMSTIAGVSLSQATKAAGLPGQAASIAATEYKYLNPTSAMYVCSSYNKTN